MYIKLIYVLIGLEFCWIVYFLAVNITVYVQTNDVPDPSGRSIRQDVFGLGSHLAVLLANCAVIRTGNGWVFIIFVFEIIRDGINLANIGWYSELSLLHSLWVAVFALTWYQLFASTLSLALYLWTVYTDATMVEVAAHTAKKGKRLVERV
jgi:hypothetical protein